MSTRAEVAAAANAAAVASALLGRPTTRVCGERGKGESMASQRTIALGAAIVLWAVAVQARAQAIPSEDGTYSGCYNRHTGILRLISPGAGHQCTKGELATSWNVAAGDEGLRDLIVGEAEARQNADAQTLAAAKAYADTKVGAPAACPQGTCGSGGSCRYDKDCPTGETCRDPVPRFVHGNGTVFDLRTCLTWEKKTGTVGTAIDCEQIECADPHNVNNRYRWEVLGDLFVNRLNDTAFGGYTDWRLPHVALTSLSIVRDPELESILLGPYPCTTSPCIDTSVFGPTGVETGIGGPGVVDGCYWARDPDFFDVNWELHKAVVCFGSVVHGRISSRFAQYPQYVRAVRGP